MKGPRGMIAEAIANALAEFFVVDQSAMETRLLANAQIVLHDTQLKSQVVVLSDRLTGTIEGVVEAVAFEWHWGHDDKQKGGSDWVKDAKLTISGLKFTAELSETDAVDGENPSPKKTQETLKQDKKEAKGFMAYALDQVQRIIDTLTLSVTDFEITIKLPSTGQSLVVGGSGLELSSLGLVEGEPLKQLLVISSIFSNVHVDENSVYPLLKPISYKASCVRTFGKRFLGGIDKGLKVMGESSDDGIVIHLGAEQIEFCNSLLGLLLQIEGKKDGADPIQDEKIESEDDDFDNQSSFFQLPLAAVSLVFPNNAKISLSGLVAKYQMDGSVLSIEGRDGFLVNDFPFFRMGGTCLWCADAARNKFELRDTAMKNPSENCHDEIVAFVHARDAEIQSVKDGINQALAIYKGLNDGTAAALVEKAVAGDAVLPPQSASPLWSFELVGRLSGLWEGSHDEIEGEFMVRGVKASMESLSVEIDAVEQIYVPGTIKLKEPIENTVMTFDGAVFDIQIWDIVATLEEAITQTTDVVSISPESSAQKSVGVSTIIESTSTIDSDVSSTAPPFILPFGVKAAINKVVIFNAGDESNPTTVKKMRLALGPDAAPEEKSERPGGIRAALIIDSIDSEMITLQEPCLSGLVFLDDLDTVPRFNFDAKSIAVAAGYTALDWKRLVDVDTRRQKKKKQKSKKHSKTEPLKPISLPFSRVQPLKIKVIISGDLVGFKESTMHIGAFDGNEGTTSDDLIRFYSTRVVSRVPNMIINANVLGADVQENVVTHFGGAAGSAALGGLGAAAGSVGGVLSLAAFDGVRNTIKAGKKSRGAESDDKFQPLDIFRGLKEAATDASRGGATRRGKTEEQKGDPLDWAVGATVDVANYTNDNKSRLGGAGAGTIGFAYGMVLGGPVGAVAGAFLASVATSKTVDVVSDKIGKGKRS